MELPHIGETCVICNRNDYLPFKCAHCTKIVCIDHKVNHGFDCPLARTKFEFDISSKTNAESIRKACDFCRKITLELELSKCLHCSGNHCLYHRHQIQHKCPKLALDSEARLRDEVEKNEKRQEALNRLKAVTEVAQRPIHVNHSQAPIDLKKVALARRVNVMRIKQSARGPPNVLDKDKLFFEAEFKHNPQSSLSNASKNGKKLNIFATRAHTIGRLVDFTASELDITNRNQISGSDQIVFQAAGVDSLQSVTLDSQFTFQHYLEANVLVSGDKLFITYESQSIK